MRKNVMAVLAFSAMVSCAAMANEVAVTGPTINLQLGGASFQGLPSSSELVNHIPQGYNVYKDSYGGFFLGGALGYEHALSSQFAVGVEVGVNNGFDLYDVTFSSTSGNQADSKVSYSVFSIPVLLTAKYIFPVGINFFVKGGLAWNRYTQDVSGPSGSSNSYNKIAPEVAVGAGYQVGNFNLFMQYAQVFGSKLSSLAINGQEKAISMGALTVGASYTLPM